MGVFSFAEYCVLWFIFDRTIGFGKKWERVTLDQLEFGVWSGDKCILPGVGGTRATVVKCLTALVGDKYRNERGDTVLVRNYGPHREINYAINFNYTVPQTMMPIPKRLRVSDGSNTKLDKFRNYTEVGLDSKLDSVQNLNPNRTKNNRTKNRTKNKCEDFPRSAPKSLRDKLEEVTSKHVAKRASKAEKALNPGSTLADLNALWKASVVALVPGTPVWDWTAKERGMVSTLRRKWEASGGARGTFGAFLKWCVDEWGPLMHYVYPSKSAYRMHAPEVPVLPVLVKNVRTFITHYHGGDIEARKRENSAHSLAKREKQLEELREQELKARDRLRKTGEVLQNAEAAARMAARGYGRRLTKHEPLGEDVKVDTMEHLLDQFEPKHAKNQKRKIRDR